MAGVQQRRESLDEPDTPPLAHGFLVNQPQRYFILRDGTLAYYKVSGTKSRAVLALLRHELAESSHQHFIGNVDDAIASLEEADKREHAASPASAPVVRGVLHISQALSISALEGDPTRFSIATKSASFELRAANAADRAAWLEVLRAHRAFYSAAPGRRQSAQHRQPAAVGAAAAALSERLEADAAAFAAGQLRSVVLSYEQVLARERKRRATLRARLAHAQAERQRLEFSVVREAAAALGLSSDAVAAALEAGGGHARTLSLTSGSTPSAGGAPASLRRRATMGAGEMSASRGLHSPSLDGGSGSDDGSFSTGSQLSNSDDDYDDEQAGRGLAHSDSGQEVFFECEAGSGPGSASGSPRGSSGAEATVRELLPPWGAECVPPLARRRSLPAAVEREVRPSLWSVIKDALGKDITRIALPVTFNEPLSALQMFAEQLEYSDVLDRAALAPAGSRERHCLVAAFAVSGYAAAAQRSSSCKPFNPLERETYELVCPDKGFRFLAEKVLHHPLQLAAHAQGRGWSFWGETSIKTKFWGRSISLVPAGLLHVRFADGDSYSWRKVPTQIGNIILGPPSIDFTGLTRVVCHATGASVRLRFREPSGLMGGAGSRRQVRGTWEAGSGRAALAAAAEAEEASSPRAGGGAHSQPPEVLTGAWDSHVSLLERGGGGAAPPAQRPLWRRAQPAEPPGRYGFTEFACRLNEMPRSEEPSDSPPPPLPPTDSRLRPDQRLLEEGRFAAADALKAKLEEAQRRARKAAADAGVPPAQPRWFKPQPLDVAVAAGGLVPASGGAGAPAGASVYAYAGGYWEAREARDWGPLQLPQIFGSATPQ